MATTTNYSWTTPDDTDLVKDGAAAIRTLGSSIDTTVFTNAGAAVAKATVDAKGDLLVGTADNTVDRLAVGTDGYTLVADSVETTGLKWVAPASSGGMTSIASGNMPTGTTTLTISSIPTTYNQLLLQVRDVFGLSPSNIMRVRINNISTTSYASSTDNRQTTVPLTAIQFDGTNNTFDATGNQIFFQVSLENYATTNAVKMGRTMWGNRSDGVYTNSFWAQNSQSTTAITRIDVISSNANFNGGTYVLWGIK